MVFIKLQDSKRGKYLNRWLSGLIALAFYVIGQPMEASEQAVMKIQPYPYDLAAKMARVTESVWQVPESKEAKDVALKFHYEGQKISRLLVFSSSGNPAIARSAMTALYKAAEQLDEPGPIDCWFGLGTKEFVPIGRTKSGAVITGLAPRVLLYHLNTWGCSIRTQPTHAIIPMGNRIWQITLTGFQDP